MNGYVAGRGRQVGEFDVGCDVSPRCCCSPPACWARWIGAYAADPACPGRAGAEAGRRVRRGSDAARRRRSSSARARPTGIRRSRRWSRRSRTSTPRLQKQGIKPAGPPMTIYTATDDTGFEYQAGVPVAERAEGSAAGEGLAVGKSPDGRALKFIHRGSYDAMDFDLRGDHQPSRREAARGARPVRRVLPHRSADDAGRQSGDRGLRAGQMTAQPSSRTRRSREPGSRELRRWRAPRHPRPGPA